MTKVREVNLSEFMGHTFASVERLPRESVRHPSSWRISGMFGCDEVLLFTGTSGVRFVMGHDSDCCETVKLADVNGDLADLCGVPIVLADEALSHDDPSHAPEGWNADEHRNEWDESYTWTFYRLATVKGHVDIRWFGQSNGYYSERVSIYRVDPGVELRL